ncbi:MAG: HEAT repeat domain-containing protein [Chthoniobacterales bacterium]
MKPHLLALLPILLAASAMGQDAQRIASSPSMNLHPVPKDAKVSLIFPKTTYRLGSNILATFRLENTGTTAFPCTYRDHYDESGFPMWCRVIVKDSSGNVLPDIAMRAADVGGFEVHMLKAGAKFDQAIPISRYSAITAAGHYTVSVSNDFGWKETAELKFPVAEGAFDVVLPTAQEADAQVAALLTAETTSDDFALLRNPIFLPALIKYAQSGNTLAVTGIMSIETKESTAALISLLSSSNTEITIEALKALSNRLPDFTFEEYGRKPGEVARLTWDAKFEPEMHRQALKLLQSSNETLVMYGAAIICVIGKPDDMPAIAAALQRVLDRIQEEKKTYPEVSNEPPAKEELEEAVQALITKGARMDGTGSTADILIFLRQLSEPNIPRPANNQWKDIIKAAMNEKSPTLRGAALLAIPTSFDDEWLPTVIQGLRDNNNYVKITACRVAGNSHNPKLIAPLLQLLEGSNDIWLTRYAKCAAWQLGSRSDLLEVRSKKMAEPSGLH